MNRRRLFSAAFSLALLAAVSCSGTNAYAARRRAVAPPPATPAIVQWGHDSLRGDVYYEIFVRSFHDSNGDGIGDINGLISKLDYLNDGNPATTTDLGIDGIWLMPVFESPSYHGYDTVDYETIERDYGTNADFARLLDEAHRRGIRVIVDFVMNHSSSQHPWFVESASSTSSPRREWYVWRDADPGWKQPWGGSNGTWHQRNGAYYYGVFWGGMPDLNFRSEAVRAELTRLAKMWLALGVDGFRLDATRYLVESGGAGGQADIAETHPALKEFAAAVRQADPSAVLVAENWTETPIIATYFGSTSVIRGGDEMPLNFNFPLSSAIVGGVNSGNASQIRTTLEAVLAAYPAGVIDTPFLTNHDQTRLASVLGNNVGKLRSAAAVLLTMPGVPFLYYGEEVGLDNGPTSGDESKRTPMPWTSSGGFTTGTPWFGYAPGLAGDNVGVQTGDPGSLLSHYRNWIAARKSSSALRLGTLELLAPASNQVLAFMRESADERVLVVHNVSDSFASGGPFAVSAAGFTRVLSDSGVTDPSGVSGSWRVSLPPKTSGAWRVR